MTRWFGNNEQYFEQLREFVPRDALAILEQQKSKITKAVSEEIGDFGNALAEPIRLLAFHCERQHGDAIGLLGQCKSRRRLPQVQRHECERPEQQGDGREIDTPA